jgi:predicted PurR-regulated permease PerM
MGFGTGLLLALLTCILQFGLAQALFIVSVVYGCGQLIEGFILTPKLVGKRIGLHPLGLIFALLAFGQILGFVGVLVALPVSTITLVAIRRIKEKYLTTNVYTG